MTTLYCSRLIPSSCIHNLARWTERGAATEVLLSTSPPSWAYSAPSSPKVGCLLLSVCTGPLFIVAGYQYNVSKSAVVTLTRCIGNEVVSSVTSTGNHLGAVVTVLSNHSIVLYSDPAVIGFNSCLPCYCFLTKCVRWQTHVTIELNIIAVLLLADGGEGCVSVPERGPDPHPARLQPRGDRQDEGGRGRPHDARVRGRGPREAVGGRQELELFNFDIDTL